MKKWLVLTCILMWLNVSWVAGQEKAPSVDTIAEKVAKEFVILLTQGKFQDATAVFDKDMKAALPPEKLATLWKDQQTALGNYQKIIGTRVENYQQFRIVYVTCQFQKQSVDVKVVVDNANKIAGLFFVPTQHDEYRTPSYANPSQFKEIDVTVGKGEWTLPGILSMPSGKGPFPAVILVHGSGPQDRDESIGPNKPFKDIAWGLASQGIAVLRYDKRTYKYGSKLAEIKELTVKEETISDALEAVSLLRKTEGVDSKKIFILGHSLGGMLAPRIASGNPDIAGLIILAGAARPLEDLIVEQTLYQAFLTGKLTPDGQKKIDEIKKEAALIKSLTKENPVPGNILGAPSSYWLDLKDYKPAESAKTLKQPMLILQGENDCQVKMTDFNIWRAALSNRKNVTFQSYLLYNHFFMEFRGKSTDEDYVFGKNVSGRVVDDIVKWIKEN